MTSPTPAERVYAIPAVLRDIIERLDKSSLTAMIRVEKMLVPEVAKVLYASLGGRTSEELRCLTLLKSSVSKIAMSIRYSQQPKTEGTDRQEWNTIFPLCVPRIYVAPQSTLPIVLQLVLGEGTTVNSVKLAEITPEEAEALVDGATAFLPGLEKIVIMKQFPTAVVFTMRNDEKCVEHRVAILLQSQQSVQQALALIEQWSTERFAVQFDIAFGYYGDIPLPDAAINSLDAALRGLYSNEGITPRLLDLSATGLDSARLLAMPIAQPGQELARHVRDLRLPCDIPVSLNTFRQLARVFGANLESLSVCEAVGARDLPAISFDTFLGLSDVIATSMPALRKLHIAIPFSLANERSCLNELDGNMYSGRLTELTIDLMEDAMARQRSTAYANLPRYAARLLCPSGKLTIRYYEFLGQGMPKRPARGVYNDFIEYIAGYANSCLLY